MDNNAFQQFIQSLTNPLAAANNFKQAAQGTGVNSPGKFAQSIADGIGGAVGGAVNAVNPFNPNGVEQTVALHPSSIPSDISNIASGVGQSVNNTLGQPVNPNTGQLQLPSQKEEASYFLQNPVAAAANVAGLSSIGGKLLGGGAKAAATEEAAPGVLGKMARSINQTNNIKLPSDVNGAADENFVQSVLNNDVKGKSLSEKYANLQPTMDKFGKQIQSALAASPKDIPVDDIRSILNQRMQPLVAQGTLSAEDAASQVEGYLSRMYQQANPSGAMPPIENVRTAGGGLAIPQEQQLPSTIDSNTAFNMKLVGNKAAGGLFGKENLTPAQSTTLALRNGMDDVISKYHPEIKDLTMKQSALFKAADEGNLGGLRSISSGIGVGVPGMGKIGVPGAIATPIRGAASSVLNGLESVSRTGLNRLPLLAPFVAGKGVNDQSNNDLQNETNNLPGESQNVQGNAKLNNVDNNIHDYTQIPQAVNDIKPDQSGNYQVASPYTIKGADSQALALSPAAYTQQMAALNQVAALPQNQVWPNTQKIQSQIDSLGTKYNESKGLGAVYTAAQSYNDAAVDARNLLKDASPNFFNAIPTLDALRKSVDPKYAALQSDLSVLEQKYPISLQGALTPQVLTATINQTNKQFLSDYYKYLNNYVGGAGASGGGNSQIAQTQGTQLPSSSPTGLAPIQQGGSGGLVKGTGTGGFAGLAPLPGQ